MTNTAAAATTLDTFTADVQRLVHAIDDEFALTERVADRLRAALAAGLAIPAAQLRPDPERYVMYPMYVAPDESFSIASAVWDVGQQTPVHGHETWGVVGIYAGVEREMRYVKPTRPDVPLEPAGTDDWGPGDVTVCCTTDDDVHQVRCGGDEPCIGVHVYGGNIGTLRRRSYDPRTGAVDWFVSRWATPDVS